MNEISPLTGTARYLTLRVAGVNRNEFGVKSQPGGVEYLRQGAGDCELRPRSEASRGQTSSIQTRSTQTSSI